MTNASLECQSAEYQDEIRHKQVEGENGIIPVSLIVELVKSLRLFSREKDSRRKSKDSFLQSARKE